MFRHVVYLFVFVLTVVIAGVASAQETTGVKISDEYYHPGIVLLFQSGEWVPASPAKINYLQENYVLVHGAHSESVCAKSDETARAILKHNPNANLLQIDWERWSVFRTKQLNEVVVEEIFEYFNRDVSDLEKNFDEIFDDFFKTVVLRVAGNLIPFEQTQKIPEVADRAEKILFERKGKSLTFTTDGKTGVAIALGLAPEKTNFIAHSHGAHIAGLIGERAERLRKKKVARITALDPSEGEIQLSAENLHGDGWSSDSAKFVDVVRTSEILCGDKLYGDVNLWLRDASHPLRRLEDDDLDFFSTIDALVDGLKFDVTRHSFSQEIFQELFQKGFYWELPEAFDKNDSDHWIIINE